ncbi:MAG: ABC transporter ATP-binding protein [Proteobacteria bacterium]|nr:ABC transporter ATP-binding protein [Pseudomonadota bacterium]
MPGHETIALEDFSLAVAKGEFVSLLGPSGCGKTTALRILADLETASSGTARIHRRKGTDSPSNSMVFQEHSLFPWLSVIDNVAYGLEMRGVAKQERLDRARPFLEMVGLAKFANHYPGQLSGGMRQRVSLARAYVNDPDVLLMDEPFAALDAQNKLIMQQELLRIWEKDRKTVLFVTHAIDEAIVLSDRIVVMTAAPGRIKRIISVDFPRPRNAAEMRADSRFGNLSLDIWRTLEEEVLTARAQADG